MGKIRFGSPEPEEDDGFDDGPTSSPKWFYIFESEPAEVSNEVLQEHTVTSYKIEAQRVLEQLEKDYQNKLSKASKSSDEGWLRTVLQKGTSGDKVAALILSVQKSPLSNLNALQQLVGMVKVSKKKQCVSVLDNLCELLVDELLPPGRKLRTWSQHPFHHLKSLTSPKDRNRFLSAWLYESRLKEVYGELVGSLEVLAKDTVDAYREKAISALYKLLSAHPEQEQVLLSSLVNKLGDPVQKVVSKVIYCMTQLLRNHPNMKLVVMHQVETILFRSNIGARTQYYAICFLSQFVFTDKDQEVARYLIKIYFSFFKSSIKKGDVDSRLMGGLLMGVKRAFPYAKLDAGSLDEHVQTLYKLVHISPFNISLHTLCLLEQVSLHSQDRFYSALYKKLLDSKLVSTSQQAMFINMLYKALSKDTNTPRVIAILKRLFQVCLEMPVCFLCGMLYMVSQLMKTKELLAIESTAVDAVSQFDESSDDDGEVYHDADKLEGEGEKDKVVQKGARGWNFVELTKTREKKRRYDWRARNPAYAHADLCAYFELLDLARHYHPTVALFAQKIIDGEPIVYTGDPLADFSLIRFLDRFSFKNPKSNDRLGSEYVKGPDPKLAQRKYYKPSGVKGVSVHSKQYLNQDDNFIPVDELFLFRYLKEKDSGGKSETKDTENPDEDFDDNSSVSDGEFEQMLDSMVGKKKQRDYMADVGDKLKKGQSDQDSEGESSEEEEDGGSDDEEEEGEDSELGSELGSDDEEDLEFSEGSGPDEDIDVDEFLNNSSHKTKLKTIKSGLKKQKKRGGGLDGLFAPAEEFSELLEETGSSKSKSGMFNQLANPENAAEKQLNWEVKRDRWVRGANQKKRKLNRPGGKFRKKFKN